MSEKALLEKAKNAGCPHTDILAYLRKESGMPGGELKEIYCHVCEKGWAIENSEVRFYVDLAEKKKT